MTNMTKDQAYLNGFIKAANGMQIPPIGAPSTPPGVQPGQPTQPGTQAPGGQPGGPAQMPQLSMGGKPGMPQQNQMFYQLLQQFKQQNPQPQAPPAVPNMHNRPMPM